MNPHNIKFTDAQWQAVKVIAEQSGLTTSEVVRNAVQKLAKSQRVQIDPIPRKKG